MRHNLVAEALGKELAERRQGARCRNHLAPPASEIDKVPRDLGALGTCTVPKLGAVVCKCCGQDQFQVACAVLTVERAADKVKQALQRRCAHARQLALGGGGVRESEMPVHGAPLLRKICGDLVHKLHMRIKIALY